MHESDRGSHRVPGDREETPPPQPLYCTDGPTLCRLRVLSDEEWNALPQAHRPRRAEWVVGLGWVASFPETHLN
jgi:hypothetical protein